MAQQKFTLYFNPEKKKDSAILAFFESLEQGQKSPWVKDVLYDALDLETAKAQTPAQKTAPAAQIFEDAPAASPGSQIKKRDISPAPVPADPRQSLKELM